MAVSSQDYTA